MMKKYKNTLIITAVAVVLYCLLFLFYDQIYIANDDIMIENILSGRFSGKPNSMTVYFNQPLSFVISLFYRVIRSIPWFGLFQNACIVICLCLVLSVVLEKYEQPRKRIFYIVLYAIGFLAIFGKAIVLVTYTTTAAITGATGLFLLINARKGDSYKQDIKSFLWPIILFALTYLIRTNVFVMLIPFIGVSGIVNMVNNNEKKLKKYFGIIGTMAGVIVILVIVNKSCYSSEEWKDYLDYNDFRTTIYDFVYVDASDEAIESYALASIPKLEVNAMINYDNMLCEDNCSMPLALSAMRTMGKSGTIFFYQAMSIKSAIYNYLHRLRDCTDDMHYGYTAIILYVLVVFCAITSRKYKYFWLSALLFVVRSLLWIYLIWRGRSPERVTMSLFFFELAILLQLVACQIKEISKITIRRAFIGFVLVMLILGNVFGFINTGKAVNKQLTVNATYDVIYSYMRANSDKLYLLDTNSFPNYTGYVMKNYNSNFDNSIILGGWMIKHPLVNEKMAYAGFESVPEAFNSRTGVGILCRENCIMTEEFIKAGYVLKESFEYEPDNRMLLFAQDD